MRGQPDRENSPVTASLRAACWKWSHCSQAGRRAAGLVSEVSCYCSPLEKPSNAHAPLHDPLCKRPHPQLMRYLIPPLGMRYLGEKAGQGQGSRNRGLCFHMLSWPTSVHQLQSGPSKASCDERRKDERCLNSGKARLISLGASSPFRTRSLPSFARSSTTTSHWLLLYRCCSDDAIFYLHSPTFLIPCSALAASFFHEAELGYTHPISNPAVGTYLSTSYSSPHS